MGTQVKGLLLINAKGEKYFIQSGIGIFRRDIPSASSGQGGNDLPVQPINQAAHEALQADARKEWFEKHRPGSPEDPSKDKNLGPIILQAFNVTVERTDDGGDAEVTGNGAFIDSF